MLSLQRNRFDFNKPGENNAAEKITVEIQLRTLLVFVVILLVHVLQSFVMKMNWPFHFGAVAN